MILDGSRLGWALVGSVLGNGLFWYLLSTGASRTDPPPTPPELVFDRVTINEEHKIVPKKPDPKPIVKPKPPPPPKEPPVRVVKPVAPPQGAHNRVLTSRLMPGPKPPSDFKALAGGNAQLGKPTDTQAAGNSVVNPPTPTPPVQPTPAPPPPPTPPTPQPAPPAPTPKPAPPPPPPSPPPPPPPPPPPVKHGPTQDATATHQENPELPDNLKSQSFKSFVRVKVNIAADGSFDVVLRTSSGNDDVDKLVLDALKRWKWKPALKDGDPVDSVQLFRFNFVVQ